jgi:hypothetical protein
MLLTLLSNQAGGGGPPPPTDYVRVIGNKLATSGIIEVSVANLTVYVVTLRI